TRKVSVATNSNELNQILEEINRLEKSEIKQKNYYEYEETFTYLLVVLLILMLYDVLRRTIIRKDIP
nr:hypothetical protein [Candidatus Cloacimonadota bacterium]